MQGRKSACPAGEAGFQPNTKRKKKPRCFANFQASRGSGEALCREVWRHGLWLRANLGYLRKRLRMGRNSAETVPALILSVVNVRESSEIRARNTRLSVEPGHMGWLTPEHRWGLPSLRTGALSHHHGGTLVDTACGEPTAEDRGSLCPSGQLFYLWDCGPPQAA